MTDGNGFIANFHFLRPWFLCALPLGLAFFYLFRKRLASQSNWNDVIDPQLLSHLIDQPTQIEKRHWPIVSLLIGWIIACLAMAGPAWERTPQEVVKNQNAYILILDLSLSMYAEDQKPSRLINAKHKIADLMATRKDGLTALIVYSGDAHIVSPMTDDNETVNTLLPALEPNMMPKFGTNLEDALKKAGQLLDSSGLKLAEVVLFTDEITPSQFSLLDSLKDKNLHLSIITFGTGSGAPIPLNNGFLKDRSGNTVLAKLNWSDISSFAHNANLLAVQSSIDDQDIQLLLRNAVSIDNHQSTERQFDLWKDNGHWLTFLLIPFLLLGFRKGWILLLFIMIIPDNSYAMNWEDLWTTKDQQAAKAMQKGDLKTASEKFEHPEWKASADYKNGNYEAALKGFSGETSAENLYNKGNTLAKMGQLDEAINAYDAALKQQANMSDAADNKALVEKLREQQKKEQQNKDQEKQENNQEDKDNTDKNQQQDGQQDQQKPDEKNSSEQNQESNDKNQSSSPNNDPKNQQQQNNNTDENSADDKDGQQNPEQKMDDKKPQDDNKNSAANSNDDKNDKENTDKQAMQPAQQDAQMTPLEKEQQQALQQWLRKIPDDPGQLLRNKFRYQYENNVQNNEHIDKKSEQLW